MRDKKYGRVHDYLRIKYGKANRCESKNCLNKSKTFDWALKKGNKYSYKRINFFMLCRSCHKKYDIKLVTINKMKIRMIGNKVGFKKGHTPWLKGKHPEYLQGKNHHMFGKTHTLKTRKKLSKSLKGRIAWNKGLKCDWLIGNTNGFKKAHIPWNKGLKYSYP